MFRGFVAGMLFTLLATAIAGYVIIRTGVIPANADDRPPPFERWAAQTSLRQTLERAPRPKDPLAVNARNLRAGMDVYMGNCAVCHGDARVHPTKIAWGLYEKPPQLGRFGQGRTPQWVTFWKVQHGIRWTGMPAFDRTMSTVQLWQVTMFLKYLRRLPPPVARAWQSARLAEALGPAIPRRRGDRR